jgi:putative ABC transport system substrate-binding protein
MLGGAAARALTARAQQAERVRRVGVLMNLAADDRERQARLAIFLRALQDAGWADGRNVKIDTRWGAGNAERYRKYAAELLALEPDIVVTATTPV